MLRFLARIALSVIGNALGLIIASLLVPDFNLSLVGLITSVLFFTGAQFVLAPLVLKLAIKYAPAFRGGIALVTTLIALILTATFTDGLQINSLSAWIISPLIVWLSTVLADIFLPMVLFKKLLSNSESSNS